MAQRMTDGSVVVVGASLAGATTAMLLARAGARVTLVEKSPDPAAYKRVCGHFIQGGCIPMLERTGLLGELEGAGAVRSRTRMRMPWGWIRPSEGVHANRSINLRREVLDPLVRRLAAETPGVELVLGRAVRELVWEDGRVAGVVAVASDGTETTLRARLVVGADGRGSKVAALADVPHTTAPHARFSYGAYYEGPGPEGTPDGTVWLTDPHWAAAFPTDSDLTLYACMPTKDRLPEFRGDIAGALEAFVAALPDAPPIRESRRVSPVMGKVEMPNVWRAASTRGVALVGDAALATDPLWGVGCGWAFEGAEWLADAVAPALRGEGSLDRGLERYARRHRRALGPHAKVIHDYAGGRRFNDGERLMFSSAARDPKLADVIQEFGTREIPPRTMMRRAGPRLAVHGFRAARAKRRDGALAGAPAPARSADEAVEQPVELGGGVLAQPGVDR